MIFKVVVSFRILLKHLGVLMRIVLKFKQGSVTETGNFSGY